jgi:hypothetical protein
VRRGRRWRCVPAWARRGRAAMTGMVAAVSWLVRWTATMRSVTSTFEHAAAKRCMSICSSFLPRQEEQIRWRNTDTYLYGIRKTYKDAYGHRYARAQLSHPSYTKAPAKNKNYNEDLGALVSRKRQKTPSTAAIEPTPTAVVEEEAMATLDLEEPHRKEALREPQKTSDA